MEAVVARLAQLAAVRDQLAMATYGVLPVQVFTTESASGGLLIRKQLPVFRAGEATNRRVWRHLSFNWQLNVR